MESSRELDLRKTIDRLRDKARRKVPESDVEDIVQEVLVVLVERMQHGRVDALQAYAEGILRHKVYDYYQRKKERSVSLDQNNDLASPNASPEQRVVFMRHLRVIEGLAKENKVDESLLNDHFVKGEPLREVASQLEVSPGVVNGRLFRFRQKITRQVGSCFAMFAAMLVGLWSRATRALMAVRVYGSVVGMLSIGSFASWVWWGKTPPPQSSYTTKAPAKTTPSIQAPRVRIPAPPPFSIFAPNDELNDALDRVAPKSSLPALRAPQRAPGTQLQADVASPALAAPAPTASPAALAPTPAAPAAHKKSPSVWAPFKLKGSQSVFGVRGGHSASSRALSAGSRGSTTQASQAARTQGTVQKGGGSSTSGSPSTGPGSSGKPSTGTPPSTGKGPSPAPKTGVLPDINNIQNSKGPSNKQGQSFRELGSSSASHTIKTLPSGVPAAGRSFCVVQDGRIYRCGGGKMTDISGLPNSPFTCGTNKLCQQMIGNGPSMLFTQGGALYILGHKRYLTSNDGGLRWQATLKPESAQSLLQKAAFVLSQSGSIWQNQKGAWKQMRQQQIGVHEIRVHLANGNVKFEDDTGFQLNASWKIVQDRIKIPSPSIPGGPSPVTPDAKIKPNNLQQSMPTTPGQDPVPTSLP